MTLFFVNVTVRVFEMYKKKFCAINSRHQRQSVDEVKIPDGHYTWPYRSSPLMKCGAVNR